MMQEMAWSLIKEAGIGLNTEVPPGIGERSPLRHPVFATHSDDGSYLIVDRLGTEKLVPYGFGCRTIRIDADHNILYDSLSNGIEDGFGCLMDNGWIAILRRTNWELLIVSPDGAVTDRLHLATFSKRLPWSVSWTCNNTFLVVFLNQGYELDIVEIDAEGRLLWSLPTGGRRVGIAMSAQLSPANTVLIADGMRHVAMEIDRTGNIVWQFGETKHPSRDIDRLSSPSSFIRTEDGRSVIADTRNHRVLLLDADGSGCQMLNHDGTFRDPMYAVLLANGNCLVCDTGNKRVIEVDEQGYIVWHYGAPVVSRRLLSYPRSVEVSSSGGYLIADTAHDRIIEVIDEQIKEIPFHDEPGLFWPRCVRMLSSGSLLIADARNHRIVEVSAEGHVLRELSHIDTDVPQALQDPHDVRVIPDGDLLITDSQQDLVVLVDWSGRVRQAIGGNGSTLLTDPHSAQYLDDGSIVIADTGHDRIIVVDPNGDIIHEFNAIYADGAWFKLHRPRYVEVASDGTMVIADTGHNRILAATLEGQLVWELSTIPDSSQPLLNQPRWVKLLGRNEVVICDHFHHRILHVRKNSQ
jgi:DNA-binding beta-propeller fold protein YncE